MILKPVVVVGIVGQLDQIRTRVKHIQKICNSMPGGIKVSWKEKRIAQ